MRRPPPEAPASTSRDFELFPCIPQPAVGVRQRLAGDAADVAEGLGGAAVGLSALMPPWGRTLSRRELADVVLYLRTLARPAQPAPPQPK